MQNTINGILASLDAAYDDVNVARLAYLSDLVSSYVNARYYQEALALSRKNLVSRRETLKLTNEIKEAGAASSLDVLQAEGLVNQTLAEPGDELVVLNVQPPLPPRARSALGADVVKGYHQDEANKVLAPIEKFLKRRDQP